MRVRARACAGDDGDASYGWDAHVGQTRDMQDQIDALLQSSQAGDADTASGDGSAGDAAKAPAAAEAGDDLAGSQFADQVQQMLDDAEAGAHDVIDGEAAQSTPPAGSGDATAPPPASADDANSDSGVGDDQIIDQIDAMLAEHADEIAGDFASVEELDGEEAGLTLPPGADAGVADGVKMPGADAAAPADGVKVKAAPAEPEPAERIKPAPAAPPVDAAATREGPPEPAPDAEAQTDGQADAEGSLDAVVTDAAADADDDDGVAQAADADDAADPEGDFASMDDLDLHDDDQVEPSSRPLETELDYGSGFEGEADSDGVRIEGEDDDLSDEARAVAAELDEQEAAGVSYDNGLDDDEAYASSAPDSDADQAEAAEAAPAADVAAGPSRLLKLMAALNSPLASRSVLVRNTIGCIALSVLMCAVVLLTKAVAGTAAAVGLGFVLLLGFAAVVFVLIVRAEEPTASDPPAADA